MQCFLDSLCENGRQQISGKMPKFSNMDRRNLKRIFGKDHKVQAPKMCVDLKDHFVKPSFYKNYSLRAAQGWTSMEGYNQKTTICKNKLWKALIWSKKKQQTLYLEQNMSERIIVSDHQRSIWEETAAFFQILNMEENMWGSGLYLGNPPAQMFLFELRAKTI